MAAPKLESKILFDDGECRIVEHPNGSVIAYCYVTDEWGHKYWKEEAVYASSSPMTKVLGAILNKLDAKKKSGNN